jgi:Family of unknown function (DUF6526)
MKEQNFSHHARFDPAFHFFVLPFLTLNVIAHLVHVYRQPFRFNLWLVIVSVALLILAFKVRNYAVKVQDRVITLEERLRLSSILPDALKARALALTTDQLIGLRFASDGELPALVEKTLNEKLARKEIKQAVQNWRADYRRV